MSAAVIELYRRWQPLINASGLSDSEMAAVVEEIAAIERQMAATPAATAPALLCKAKVADHYIRIGWVYEKERDMIVSLIADLERLSDGAS